ncbi:mechanosensitive ion channel family protein [Azospirillum sp. TSO35-2]|uniref:mechanosensitive ion channel family protein n=1 Tax=Azospirillum sp. TSO35-2 TaxID=716796 RepID=UPI000D620833|nr:mechanosensitive ion channel family protein [Azospirillum sp. TSO35-2]PWC33967.1 hypothetical protein TSO352_26850 [Azospirillum sp. TSO35-2]
MRAVIRGAMGWPARSLAILALVVMLAPAALAQSPAGSSAPSAPPPAQVRQLLDLLADPAVRVWIDAQRTSGPVPAAATATVGSLEDAFWMSGATRLALIRQHLETLADALPMVPDDLANAWTLLKFEFEQRGLLNILALVAGFLTLGLGTEWLFWWATKSARRWVVEHPLDTVGQRLRAIGARFVFGLGVVAAFALGSIGAFLIFDWPVFLKEIVLGYLMVFVVARVGMVLGRFLLAPAAERFRIIPMPTPVAWFWYRRVPLAVAWWSFGWVTLQLLKTLGFPPASRELVGYGWGLGLLALGLNTVWSRVRTAPGTAPEIGDQGRDQGGGVRRWLLSLYLVGLWGLWVAHFPGAFWIAVVALVLPIAIALVRRAAIHLLSPPDGAAVPTPTVTIVYVERGARAVLIIGATLLLARVWDIDMMALSGQDADITRFLRGVVHAILIVLVADLVWGLFCAVVDGRLMHARHGDGAISEEEARRNARLRTLLPILRNIMFIALLAIAGLMVLSELGIDTGPLIAGAGVVGVAVGFGAQTLVKDIISGIFYLLDDAFHIGEYIQSDHYRGTVESFSLRSVKLRHHRGSLYTIPFGSLGAVQNMSRDWVIDKMTINVPYDTDLELAKKIVKKVGQILLEDPEDGHFILETLKMQGVEQFGDFAIAIRMKIMTKPGEQFTIRRKAYALLKTQFDANGIRFAVPTVRVAGDPGSSQAGEGAAAQAGLNLAAAPPPP